jgi:hypothetical protein
MNYIADDSTFPTRVEFADGRMVAIKTENGKTFLGVGLVPPRTPEEKSYEELIEALDSCSMTYLPALLKRIIYLCVRRGVFQKQGLTRWIEVCETKAAEGVDNV